MKTISMLTHIPAGSDYLTRNQLNHNPALELELHYSQYIAVNFN